MHDLGIEQKKNIGAYDYQNEFQLTTKGNIYNLSEAAAWIADTRDDPD